MGTKIPPATTLPILATAGRAVPAEMQRLNTPYLAGRSASRSTLLPDGIPLARNAVQKTSPAKIQQMPAEMLREIAGYLQGKDVVALREAVPGIYPAIQREVIAARIEIKEIEARVAAIKQKLPKMRILKDFQNLFEKTPTILSLPADKQDEILTQLPSLIFELDRGCQQNAMEYLRSVFMPESEPQQPLIRAFQASASKGFPAFVEDHKASVKKAITLAESIDYLHEKISDLVKQVGLSYVSDSVTMESIACDHVMKIYNKIDPTISAAIRSRDSSAPAEVDKAILAIADRHGICQGIHTKDNTSTKNHIRKEVAKHAFEHGEKMQDVLRGFRIKNAREISGLPEYNMNENFKYEDLSKLDNVQQFNGLLYGKMSILTLPEDSQGELLAALACRIRRLPWNDQQEAINSLLSARMPSPAYRPALLKQVLEVARKYGQMGLIDEENSRHNKALESARSANYRSETASDLVNRYRITDSKSIEKIEVIASNRFMNIHETVDPAIAAAIRNHTSTGPEEADKAVKAIADRNGISTDAGRGNARVEIAKHAIERGEDLGASLKTLRIITPATVTYLEAPAVSRLLTTYKTIGDKSISEAITSSDSAKAVEAIIAFAKGHRASTTSCLKALIKAIADEVLANGANREKLGDFLYATNLCDHSLLAELDVGNYRLAVGH